MFSSLTVVVIVSTIYIISPDLVEAGSRQKRCIVIQKQSGTHGDSAEGDGEDEEYRKPQPKEPRPDRLRRPRPYSTNKDQDAENLSPELLKYKILPMRPLNNEYRFRNRLFRKYL